MPDPVVTPGKLARSAHLFYIDTNFDVTNGSPSWFLVGKDVEDMSVELNPTVETVKNILDENTVNDNGYEPSISVDTYYANPSDGTFYEKLRDIAMNRRTGEACRTLVLEVLVDSTSTPYRGWIEEAVIKPQSYGGAQGGVRIPYNVHFDGNRQQGNVTALSADKKTPTFVLSGSSNVGNS